MPETPMPQMAQSIYARSIYGHKTKRGLVQIDFLNIDRSRPLTIEPEEAREIAINLLQCAEAAEQDHFLMEFFTNTVKMSIEEAVTLLNDYRKFRERNQKETL